jgi:hypothetical protein
LRKRDRTTTSDAAGIGEVKRGRRPVCAESARADGGGELIPAPQRRAPKPSVSSGAVQGPKAWNSLLETARETHLRLPRG